MFPFISKFHTRGHTKKCTLPLLKALDIRERNFFIGLLVRALLSIQDLFQIMNKAASTAFYKLFIENCLKAQSLISWQIKHVKKREQKGGVGSCSSCVASIWHPQSTKGKE